MSHSCEFVTGASGGTSGTPEIIQCEAPAPIKHGGRWLCAKHYDIAEEYGTAGLTSAPISGESSTRQ